MAGEPWLVYALGGGLGHATRALALARVAAKRGHRVHVVVNTGRLPPEAREGTGLTLERVPLAGGPAEVKKTVERLRSVKYAAWVVDTFPRGLVGELAPYLDALPPARVWIHRDLAPAYAERPYVLEAARRYRLTLVPGPDEQAPLAEAVGARRTAPWFIRDRAELLPAREARKRLEAREGQRVVAVSGAGTDAEGAQMAALAERLQVALGAKVAVRALSPDGAKGSMRCWPLLELLPGVDVLVGGGGYNTVSEARATGTPLVALARPRLYDRQVDRLRPQERAEGPDDVLRKVAEALERLGSRPRPDVPEYVNGAYEAVEAIEALIAAK